MARDDRFYAFIIAHTPHPSSRIRRFCVEKRSLRASAFVGALLLCGSLYGFYGLTQQAAHLHTEAENQRLRAENDRQRRELNELNSRVEAVEDTSRKLAEKSGLIEEAALPGTGGPALPLDADSFAALESKMQNLERSMSAHESVLRDRGYTPTVWPVVGKLESGFGGRGNPFGGGFLRISLRPGYRRRVGRSGCCWSQRNGNVCGLAKRLWSAYCHRSWRGTYNPVRPSISHRCCSGPNRSQKPVYWPRWFYRALNRPAPALRGPI